MTELTRRIIISISLVLLMTTAGSLAQKKEFSPVDVKNIKDNPQVFWAKGIVFRAVLDAPPKGRTVTIDGRKVVKFQTRELGDVFAEPDVAREIAELEVGREYLFSGTIGQRKRSFLFGGGGAYFAIIQKVTAPQADASIVSDAMTKLNLKNSTNMYNMVLTTLDQIMKAVEKDAFAAASSQGLTVQQIFDPTKSQLDKVRTSVRKTLRDIEEKSKIPLEEYFVNLIVAIMALQHGYAEPAQTQYVPDAVNVEAAPDAIEAEPAAQETTLTREAWDLSEPKSNPVPEPQVVPAVTSNSGVVENPDGSASTNTVGGVAAESDSDDVLAVTSGGQVVEGADSKAAAEKAKKPAKKKKSEPKDPAGETQIAPETLPVSPQDEIDSGNPIQLR